MSENGFTSNYLHMADVLQSFTCFTSNDFVFNHSSHHSSHVNTRAGHALLTANIFVRTRSRKESVSHIALLRYTLTKTVATADSATIKSTFWIATAGGNEPRVVSRTTDCTVATADSGINSIIVGKSNRVLSR